MNGIQENKDLTGFNTFGVPARARYYVQVSDPSALPGLQRDPLSRSVPIHFLGGGSNILFTRDVDGLVIHCAIPGIRTEIISDTTALVTAGAGESWHGLVTHCVEAGLGGLENLALIPGLCGAAPIQNIGAYGRELESVLDHVEGMDLRTGEYRTLTRSACQFGYRDSIFKHQFEKKFFISSITLRLTVKNHHINSGYEALSTELGQRKNSELTIRDIYDAVVSVRRRKLPDPAVTGNAGSFFKNPVVSQSLAQDLLNTHGTMPIYNIDNQHVKIPAGWLIERAGWKGKQIGHVGVHDRQALVLVNHGGATGVEILEFSARIMEDVFQKFGISLEREVNIL